MKAFEKYTQIFGKIESLDTDISWSTGVSNMLEWLTWGTNNVLGISKTKYRNQAIKLSHDKAVSNTDLEAKQKYVAKIQDAETVASDRDNRYDRPSSSIASPCEALRRAKYFSEDYLNKEFDIFWSLVSDKYLDRFYAQFTKIAGNGRWYTHGNSGLFQNSTRIKEMQMDNLSYNPQEGLLVANELKLGGRKNHDQILKYALMFRLLSERGFIDPGTRFLLLFIGDHSEAYPWNDLIDQEIAFCQKSPKKTAKMAGESSSIEIARGSEYASTTWSDLVTFNLGCMGELDLQAQQVEHKLLWGFNETLLDKAFLDGERC